MTVMDLLERARDSIGIQRVFGDPIERDGITVIPAASVSGGGGGGSGSDEDGDSGEGGGFGLTGKPAGAYVIEGGKVTWRPAVDVNRLVSTLAMLAIVGMFTRVRLARLRRDG